MHVFFFCQHRRQRRQAGPVAASSGSHLPSYSDVNYSYSSAFSSSEMYSNVTSSPPPPYDFGDYEQAYQPHEPSPDAQPKLRKKRSAWLGSSKPQKTRASKQKQASTSATNLAAGQAHRPANECAIARSMNQAAAICDVVATRLHDVLGRSDGEEIEANNVQAMIDALSLEDTGYRPVPSNQTRGKEDQLGSRTGILNIQKSWMYANSRLPPYMVPFKVYMPTWQLFCKAANASAAVYKRPSRGEREDYVEANWRQGTKAMVLKSTPLDNSNLIAIAIRGSQWNAIDWAVNFTIEPTEPVGFLDDTGNACHEGFLQVARSMVVPVAERLRQLLEQNPSRVSSSLLFTGHSAGGAVATLLYMHMLSTSVSSRLTDFNGVFKRIHCVTFGVPPISLLPLQKPSSKNKSKDVFVSFVNEGDPIVRADFRYVTSLVRLFATPKPKTGQKTSPPRWPVPDATLSNAGQLVLIRQKPGQQDSVEHVYVSDEQLRGVVFGDPVMHHMDVYQERVRSLAVTAVTGEG